MSTSRQLSQPLRTQDLIQIMTEFGYSQIDGLCYGLAHMAMQAMFANEVEKYHGRLVVIARFFNMKKLNLKVFVEEAREKQKKISKNRELKAIYDDKNIEKEVEDFILEIPIFFEDTDIIQRPEKYPYLFKPTLAYQNAYRSFKIVASKVIEKKGGIVTFKAFSGIYSKSELMVYFKSLRELLDKNVFASAIPLAVILTNYDHTIAVGYEIKTKKWILFDNTKYYIIVAEDQLAETVLLSFESQNCIAMISRIYTTKDEEKIVRKIISQWKSQESWKTLHEPTNLKSTMQDSARCTWLHRAVEINDFEVIQRLVPLSRKTILFRDEEKKSAFYYAALGNYLKTLKYLIDQFKESPEICTMIDESLIVAAALGYLDMIKLLVTYSYTNVDKLFNAAAKNKHNHVVLFFATRFEVIIDFFSNQENVIPLNARRIIKADVIKWAQQIKSENILYSLAQYFFSHASTPDLLFSIFARLKKKKIIDFKEYLIANYLINASKNMSELFHRIEIVCSHQRLNSLPNEFIRVINLIKEKIPSESFQVSKKRRRY